jgi:type IV secretory pathway VirB10-like protein
VENEQDKQDQERVGGRRTQRLDGEQADPKPKGGRVLGRKQGEEPDHDDLDKQFDEPKPKAKNRFNLADLVNVDEKDAQTSRKVKVWGFVAVCGLWFALIVMKPTPPPPPVQTAEHAKGPQLLTATDVQNYEADLRQKIEAQKRQMEMDRQHIAQVQGQNAPSATQFPAPLSAEDQARLNALNAQPPPPGYAYESQSAAASSRDSDRRSRELQARQKEDASLHASNLAITGESKEQRPESRPQQVGAGEEPSGVYPSYPYIQSSYAAERVPNGPATCNDLPVSYNRQNAPGEKNEYAATPAAGTAAANTEKRHKEDSSYAAYVGKLYRLSEDTIIDSVLVNRLNNSFSGPVIAQVATDVFSHDNQRVLIPAGTRVVGEVKRVEGLGDQRLALTFHRMLMPDLYPVSLDHFEGLNQIGETGLRDKVNRHYVQVFGTSAALGAIAGLSQIGNNPSGLAGISPMTQYRSGFTQSISEGAMRILDRYTNILPTFTVREGTRIRIILTDDLMLPSYKNHRLPDDL